MARPKKKIDVELLKTMAGKRWTVEEMAAALHCSPDLLYRRFPRTMAAARLTGHAKLRDIQWAAALKGNASVIVHMSKHYLKQHDKLITEQKITQTNEVIIENPGITLRSHIKPSGEQ